MSTDYYLVSPSNKMAVQIESIGASGVQSYPSQPPVIEFVRYAIANFWTDVLWCDEHRLHVLDETDTEGDADWCENFEQAVGLHRFYLKNGNSIWQKEREPK